MSAAPAEGARVAWQDVPDAVRTAIERVCGAAVIEARTQPGGFSPGVAARVRCADGGRWFVKAASAELNPDAPGFHRQEARVLADLDALILTRRLPVPRPRRWSCRRHRALPSSWLLTSAAGGLLPGRPAMTASTPGRV